MIVRKRPSLCGSRQLLLQKIGQYDASRLEHADRLAASLLKEMEDVVLLHAVYLKPIFEVHGCHLRKTLRPLGYKSKVIKAIGLLVEHQGCSDLMKQSYAIPLYQLRKERILESTLSFIEQNPSRDLILIKNKDLLLKRAAMRKLCRPGNNNDRLEESKALYCGYDQAITLMLNSGLHVTPPKAPRMRHVYI